ncbi:MAG TPA: DUF1499 domain-containing protein [Deltaproteobacteria bacterium]|jgi:uncharacterized protein (DUF1499 family)|nr:DUF1499 domain-containing protein [Deltaproteobacteria bacterium]HOI06740.1 DUF1499 domain-containing protein [Deltaproteobacteria bacterium]
MRHVSLVVAATLLFSGCSGTRPEGLGVRNGELAPCPESPNCVSTKASDGQHRIAPIPYTGSSQDAMLRLVEVIRSMKRAKIVTRKENYLHVEFTSALFRFVDDVEFLVDDHARVIEFRSASQLGYSDLGVNRKRMEEVRRRFTSP